MTASVPPVAGAQAEAGNVRAKVMRERCLGEIENALHSEPIRAGVAGIEEPICRLHVNAGRGWRTICGIRVDIDLRGSGT
jgi:hypothetical protein